MCDTNPAAVLSSAKHVCVCDVPSYTFDNNSPFFLSFTLLFSPFLFKISLLPFLFSPLPFFVLSSPFFCLSFTFLSFPFFSLLSLFLFSPLPFFVSPSLFSPLPFFLLYLFFSPLPFFLIRSYRAPSLMSVMSKWYASCILLRVEQEKGARKMAEASYWWTGCDELPTLASDDDQYDTETLGVAVRRKPMMKHGTVVTPTLYLASLDINKAEARGKGHGQSQYTRMDHCGPLA